MPIIRTGSVIYGLPIGGFLEIAITVSLISCNLRTVPPHRRVAYVPLQSEFGCDNAKTGYPLHPTYD